MKIQIRRGGPSKSGAIRVREKTVYHCKECGNKYYSYHFFCPQCLGEVTSDVRYANVLQISTCPPQFDDAIDSLVKLTGRADFDFAKAFAALPWVFIRNSDPAILQHWQECLYARKVKSEILPAPPATGRKKRKVISPLFESNAPFPFFFPETLVSSLRNSTKTIPHAGTKLRWIETVLLSFRILERLYKHPTGTILFYDYIFQIEQQLSEFVESLRSSRWSESNFLKRNTKLKDSLEKMETEIEAVGQQVQEQL